LPTGEAAPHLGTISAATGDSPLHKHIMTEPRVGVPELGTFGGIESVH
jgi:hypothetical protein